MRLCSLLLLCLAAYLSSSYVISPPHMWTKLILTHHWPSTFCGMEHPVCHPNISCWTLHGLWPDKGIDCNSSWHFNSSEIEDLLPDMKKSWPDLLSPTSTGFCILTKFDIIPSKNYYKLSQIEGVIENFYSVKPKIQCVHPSKNAGFQILGQIEICFNSDFTLLDCEKHLTTTPKGHLDNHIAVDKTSGFSVCDQDVPVYYPTPS
ncbi:Ribonuclease T2 [Dissostichus eleginoides]|uniref:Ribonuclease T2 n=1 Tax=Dissostichus eleginoides TaxID=100907 RepID=A0AAD9C061_DISEL|nr:Ribonuclease T2 [Dissostichus eleginoides]